jgi:ribonuclease VapC
LAREGFRRFGGGQPSKARLNFGDCCAYGLAKVLNEPLLFVGNDFIHTDVASAL